MAKLPSTEPEQHPIVDAIWRWRESQPQWRSYRLGASSLGGDCDRAIWYAFRWATRKAFPGRMLRLFNRGHREEPVFVEELKGIGCEVWDVDPNTDRQWTAFFVDGHLKMKADAVAVGGPLGDVPHVVEMKSYNAKKFRKLTKEGVRLQNPTYYAQCQLAMLGLEMKHCLFMAACKDDDDLHVEVLELDEQFALGLVARGRSIAYSDNAPPRISEDPAFWKCKFCDAWDLCHGGQRAADVSCRTCVHAQVEDSGGWSCALHGGTLDWDAQPAACEDHLYLPDVMPHEFGKPVDGSPAWIEYENGVRNGRDATPSTTIRDTFPAKDD